jgi:hypothetical protein
LFSEKSLATLKLARRNKVEDIKKKTNYYETRDLLERYEDGPARGLSPALPKNGPVGRVQHQQPPSTPQRATPAVPPNTPANSLATPISPGLQSQLFARMSLIQTFIGFLHLTLARRDPTTASPASAQAMVRQARRRASRGRRAARERRGVALRPHLPKVLHTQRTREGRYVGGRAYVTATLLLCFFFALTGRFQSMFAQDVGISIPRRALSVRVPKPSHPLAHRLLRAPRLGSTARRR